jgi:nucleotide-binding universal stress UspA family protein
MVMQTAEVITREAFRRTVEAAQMPAGIRTILFHVHEDEGLPGRVQTALSIARAFGAHLHLLHVTPIEAYTVTDAFSTYVNEGVVEILEGEAAKLRTALEKQLASEDVSWDYEEITGALMQHLIQRAALADLVITGREPYEREFGGPAITLLGDMLQRVRTPLLIVGDDKSDVDVFGPAMVAWNGSYEAANAMRSAVPLLRIASQVRLVIVDDRGDYDFPSTAALEYLSRHDIHAELVTPLLIARTVEEELLDQAGLDGAGYIVMGGYSHTRAGEFLFGGVTRSFLKKCPVTLVMSH